MLNFALCDDNESILARLSKMLESLFIKYNFDCKVTFTSVDPNSFLAYVINNPVDVIFLDIDKDTAMKRALSRVVCSKCGLSYNLDNKELAPMHDGICDACGGTLKTRGDDNKETFITRFDTYMKETYPLIEYYKKKNNLVKIEVSNLTADEVFLEVKKVIK